MPHLVLQAVDRDHEVLSPDEFDLGGVAVPIIALSHNNNSIPDFPDLQSANLYQRIACVDEDPLHIRNDHCVRVDAPTFLQI